MNRLYLFVFAAIISQQIFSQAPDSSFNGNGFVTGPDFFDGINGIDDPADILYEEATGKLIMLNRLGGVDGVTLRRVNSDGSYDMSFGVDGVQEIPFVNDEYFINVFQHDDGYWVTGRNYFDDDIYSPVLMDINIDGSVNTSFADDGINAISSIDSFVVVSSCKGASGRIFLVGYDNKPFLTDIKASMMSFNADGTFDSDFGYVVLEGFSYLGFRSVLELPDGRILVAGEVQFEPGDYSSAMVVCFNADGSINESFGVDGFLFPEPDFEHNQFVIEEIVLGADGNTYGAGFVSTPTEGTKEMVIKFNDAGELVNDFGDEGFYFIDDWQAIEKVQIVTDASDNLYVMETTYPEGESVKQTFIYKILNTGEPDLTFGNGIPGVFRIYIPDVESYYEVIGKQMIMQPDGKIVVIGKTDGVSANDDFWIGRFTTNETPVDIIHENLLDNRMQVFPNPSSEFLSLISVKQIQQLDIISVDGRVVFSVLNPVDDLNIELLKPGVYAIRATMISGEIQQTSFIKQ